MTRARVRRCAAVRSSSLALVVLLGALAGCGGDTTGPSPQSVVGRWQATKIEFVRLNPPVVSVDLIDVGTTLELALRSDRTFFYITTTTTVPMGQVLSGTWRLRGPVMTLSFAEPFANAPQQWQFRSTVTTNTMTLAGADVPYDFDHDRVDDAAKFNLEFRR
ncbi:MAG: hypothetical protein U0167_08240 [bacterium]